MNRQNSIARITSEIMWDMIVVGGGATGVGVALDAASRGYTVCLLEQADFGKGTSSRSTKLIHGGVRYLQQGNVSLVMEALKERGILRQNAPHLVHDLAFIVPNYAWWETPFYGIGMRVYDMLAGKYGFGKSRVLSVDEVLGHIPTLDRQGLRGGVLYYDGQFDDSRLLIDLAQTAEAHGAAVVNEARVVQLLRDADDFITGVRFRDEESGEEHDVHGRCVINATGAFSDAVRQMDQPQAAKMISPSQGTHVVLARDFLPGDAAIMVPRTSDGRVMFAIPWHGHTLLGTTDVAVPEATLEPVATDEEISFLLETAGDYLARRPQRTDILSVFTGIRPLVKGDGATATLSREHTIHVAPSGLLTIAGGKWTTYRAMAEDCVNHAATLAKLEERPCVTRTLAIHGHCENPAQYGDLWMYGTAAESVEKLKVENPTWNQRLHAALPICAAQVIWAARYEMARSVEDVLARRTRALMLNTRAAIEMAPAVAALMAGELKQDAAWQKAQVGAFKKVAAGYLV